MTIKIGINGFGRIGRVIFRLSQERNDIDIVAINDISKIEHIAYMLKYDSTHGRFNGIIDIHSNYLVVNNKIVHYTSEKNPKNLHWNDFNVDIVIESSGIFLTKEKANQHILSGAKKVILAAPPKDDDIPLFVMGVNNNLYNKEKIISNASCTTNCLAPLAKIMNDNFGIVEGIMTTVHAVTATQKTVDSPAQKNWRSGRSSFQNIIPASTGAASAVGKVIKELNGKLTGISFRVPISNVSVVDLTVRLKRDTSYKEVCNTIQYASKNYLKGIIGYTNEEVVSSDFNGEKLTSIFDEKSSIMLNNHFVKLIAWYDNETGYSSKILDLSKYIMK